MIVEALLNLDPKLRFCFAGRINTEEDYKNITWYTSVDKDNTAVPGIPAPDSIPSWPEVEAEINRITPLAEWKVKMRQSDLTLMQRPREDFITSVEKGTADSDEEQKRYDAKITLRIAKPKLNVV